MQRKLIVGIGLALSAGGATAQSSVTIFGVTDASVEPVSNVGASSDGLTRMPA